MKRFTSNLCEHTDKKKRAKRTECIQERTKEALRFEGGALDPQRSSSQDRERVWKRQPRERCVTRSFMAAQPFSLFWLFCLHLCLFRPTHPQRPRVFFSFSFFYFIARPGSSSFCASLHFFPSSFVDFYWILDLFNPTDPPFCWNVISRSGLDDDLFSIHAKNFLLLCNILTQLTSQGNNKRPFFNSTY